jgi:hypothetical protein
MALAPTSGSPGALGTSSLAALLSSAIVALLAVFYAILRGKLRPENALKELREDRDARVAEARSDRDIRLAELAKQVEMWKDAHGLAEEARRSQEALLRETTMEIGRTVQHVIGALQEARVQAREEWGPGDPRGFRQDA